MKSENLSNILKLRGFKNIELDSIIETKHILKRSGGNFRQYLFFFYDQRNVEWSLRPDLTLSSVIKFIGTKGKKKIKKRTTYFFDLYNYLSYFPSFLKVRFKFGDITENFPKPTIVKSRPINDSTNSVLMKLNEVRHFYFLKDNTNFHEKKNMAVWRGNSNNSKTNLFTFGIVFS